MTNRRVCILGAGNMGRALIGGLLRSGTRPEHLSAADSEPAAREALRRDFAISAASDARSALSGATLVVLAVKPQDAHTLLTALAGVLAETRPLLVSVAAGVRIATLESWCPGVPVMRAMPNRPAMIGAGASALYAPAAIDPAQRAAAERVLRAVGDALWVDTEEALDVVTALSGSGPAYFFLLAELMAEAGAQLGLEAATARRLAAATLYGAGLMARAGDAELARLRQEVTSRGGTTAAALAVLDEAGLAVIVRRALERATQRSRELAAGSA
jgi:pyrroline-5-carboxylate reductase